MFIKINLCVTWPFVMSFDMRPLFLLLDLDEKNIKEVNVVWLHESSKLASNVLQCSYSPATSLNFINCFACILIKSIKVLRKC